MQIISVSQNCSLEEQREPGKSQLEEHYYIPRLLTEEESQIWNTKLLSSIEERNQKISFHVRFRPTKNGIEHEFFVMRDNSEQLLLRLLANKLYAVSGSLGSSCNIFCATFQNLSAQGFTYSSYLFQKHAETFLLPDVPARDERCVFFGNGPQMLEAHILDSVDNGGKEVKINGKVVYKKYQKQTRLLVLRECKNADEIHVEYEEYQLAQSQLSEQDLAELLEPVNKKFKLHGSKLDDFILFTNTRQVSQLPDPSPGEELCYMQYNSYFREFVTVFRLQVGQNVAFRIVTYAQGAMVAKRPVLKQLISLATPYMPISEYRINPFPGMMIDGKTCSIQYIALSAMNSVLTFTFCTSRRIYLQVFHIQTGSYIKLSADSMLGSVDIQQINRRQARHQTLDSIQFATRVSKYLYNAELIQESELAQYFQFYKALYWRQMLAKKQPQIFAQGYSLVWMVPDDTLMQQEIFLISCLPFTPSECILQQKIKAHQTDIFQRLVDFVNLDKEFYAAGVKQTLQDFQFYGSINPHNFFQLTPKELQQKLSQETNPLTSIHSSDCGEDRRLRAESTMTFPSFSFTMSTELEPGESGSNTDSMMRQLPPSPRRAVMVSQKISLFNDSNSIPLFSNQEVALATAFCDQLKSPAFFTERNQMLLLAPISQVFQETNNILVSVDFHLLMNRVLKAYEQSTLREVYDIVQYAINSVFFTSHFFDETSSSFYTLSVHPQRIQQQLKQDLHESQRKYAVYLSYISGLIQQLSKQYQVQQGEYLNVLKAVFGRDFYQHVNEKLSDSGFMLQHVTEYFLNEIGVEAASNAGLYLSVLKLGRAIQRGLELVDQRTSALQPQSFEYFFADHVVFTVLQAKFQAHKTHTAKLLSNPLYIDFSRDHPLAKMYAFTVFLQQQLYDYFSHQDALFLQCLLMPSREAIFQVTQSFESLLYYRVFDKSLKGLLSVLEGVEKRDKMASQQLNEAVDGTNVLYLMSKLLEKSRREIQAIVSQELTYARLLELSPLQACAVAAELVEKVVVEEHFQDVCHGNQNRTAKAQLFPPWLANRVFAVFDDAALAAQIPLSVSNYGDLSPTSRLIVQRNQPLCYNVMQERYLQEFAYFWPLSKPYSFGTTPQLNKIDVGLPVISDEEEIRPERYQKAAAIQHLKLAIDYSHATKFLTPYQQVHSIVQFEIFRRIQAEFSPMPFVDWLVQQKPVEGKIKIPPSMMFMPEPIYFRQRAQIRTAFTRHTSQSHEYTSLENIQRDLTDRTLIKYANSLNAVGVFLDSISDAQREQIQKLLNSFEPPISVNAAVLLLFSSQTRQRPQ